MAADLLFSDTPALDLNYEAAKIAQHLFIFLDYHPDYFKSCTMEGMYFRGVENLYSIFKDSAWLINEFSFCYTGEKDYKTPGNQQFSQTVDTRTLRDIFKKISDLRTLESHTSSAGNTVLTARCEAWFAERLGGKKKPGSNDDYGHLTKKLHDYANIIKCECSKFIKAVEDSPDKAGIIERWEDIIVSRYLIKQDLLMNSLRLYINAVSIGNKTNPEEMLISYFYYDYNCILDAADNFPDTRIADFLRNSAHIISEERLKELNKELKKELNEADTGISSLEDIPHISNQQKKILIKHFFKNKLKKLIDRYKSSDLNIDDLAVMIIKNTNTVLDDPESGYQFKFDRFKF